MRDNVLCKSRRTKTSVHSEGINRERKAIFSKVVSICCKFAVIYIYGLMCLSTIELSCESTSTAKFPRQNLPVTVMTCWSVPKVITKNNRTCRFDNSRKRTTMDIDFHTQSLKFAPFFINPIQFLFLPITTQYSILTH